MLVSRWPHIVDETHHEGERGDTSMAILFNGLDHVIYSSKAAHCKTKSVEVQGRGSQGVVVGFQSGM